MKLFSANGLPAFVLIFNCIRPDFFRCSSDMGTFDLSTEFDIYFWITILVLIEIDDMGRPARGSLDWGTLSLTAASLNLNLALMSEVSEAY